MKSYKYPAMKKGIIIVFALLMLPVLKVASQNKKLENFNNFKIGFFTKKLDLTSPEAEKFWPVYNEYQTQKNQIQVEKVAIIRNFNLNETTMSDNQITELGDKLISTITRESTLAVTFHKKLKDVLPPAKVIRFYQAENQYKAQLLNELQGAKQGQKQVPGRDL
jgi:hypothetical protein